MGACTGAAVAAALPVRSLPTPLQVAGKLPFLLSVMLWTIEPKKSFEERLEIVAGAGYGGAELTGEFLKWPRERFATVRRKRSELGLVFDATSGIEHGLCNPAERGAFLAEVRAILPVLEELECRRLIVLSGDKVSGLSHEQMHESCVEGLQRAAELTAPKSVEILLENIDPEENPHYFLTWSAEGFSIVQKTGSPHVKFLYDLFHEQIAEGNLIEKLEKNIGLVGTIHVADVPGRHEPGTGEINFENVFRKLGNLQYRQCVAMEFLPLGETAAALRSARELAERSVRAGVA